MHAQFLYVSYIIYKTIISLHLASDVQWNDVMSDSEMVKTVEQLDMAMDQQERRKYIYIIYLKVCL